MDLLWWVSEGNTEEAPVPIHANHAAPISCFVCHNMTKQNGDDCQAPVDSCHDSNLHWHVRQQLLDMETELAAAQLSPHSSPPSPPNLLYQKDESTHVPQQPPPYSIPPATPVHGADFSDIAHLVH